MKRNVKKEMCARGHYYDANAYTTCPHCAKLDKRPAATPDEPVAPAAPEIVPGSGYWKPEDIRGMKKLATEAEPTQVPEEPGYTRSMLQQDPPLATVPDTPATMHTPPAPEMATQTPVDPPAYGAPTYGPPISGGDKRMQTFDMKTSTIYDVQDTQPVVAWLVGIKGPCFGLSYTLQTGRNQIGRHPAMDVNIAGDMQISRSHCIITFEPNKQQFFLQPGEGSGITYCNDEAVLVPRLLQKKDVITIGTSALLFVPLCDGEFRWEDHMDGSAV